MIPPEPQTPTPEPSEGDTAKAQQAMYPRSTNPPAWPGFSPETCERIRRVAIALAHERAATAEKCPHIHYGMTLEDGLRAVNVAVLAEREKAAQAVCHFCGNDFGMWEPVAVRFGTAWKHRAKDDPKNVLDCAASAIRGASR